LLILLVGFVGACARVELPPITPVPPSLPFSDSRDLQAALSNQKKILNLTALANFSLESDGKTISGREVLVLQGAEDRIVPPTEAERIVDSLFERRIPHAYVLFRGEDHGFRGRDAIIRSFEAELSFYGQVFGFEPADPIEPIEINFLPDERAR